MNSSNFNKFIEDFSSISSSDTNTFDRIVKKYPYFQTAVLFLAKSNPVQENTQKAALRSADRKVLRSWLDDTYRQKLAQEKKEAEARKKVLKVEETHKSENLDINTESINAFDKLVGTTTIIEEKVDEIHLEENTKQEVVLEETESLEEVTNEENSNSSFFDEVDNTVTTVKEEVESKTDSSSFFDDLENNDEVEKVESTTGDTDVSFFDEVEDAQTPIFEEQSDIKNPLPINNETANTNFFDEVDEIENEMQSEPIFKEQSDINEPLEIEVPSTTTNSNFFDEVDEIESEVQSEPIFKEQSDINEPLETKVPPTTTDANFFDEVENPTSDEPIFKEQSDIHEPLETKVPPTTTDANFFDEVETDDEIFGDAQKDLDSYTFPEFKEDESKGEDKAKKSDEGGSFFDDI
ncbi:hypothetical protein [Bernardetia sp.]|uniref:hypothetical protein n=1 Tax=Bernardetia sp. TaxID=1937974 RepID=UPI0025BA0E4F|nr:hypothetical protein [Bernardetia sp.]